MPGRLISIRTTCGCSRGNSRKASSASPNAPTHSTPEPRFTMTTKLCRTCESSSTMATVIGSSLGSVIIQIYVTRTCLHKSTVLPTGIITMTMLEPSPLVQRQHQPHAGAQTNLALLLERPADMVQTFPHVRKTVPGLDCADGFTEPLAIVFDYEHQRALLDFQAEPDLVGMGVLDGIVQSFLCREEQIVPLSGRHGVFRQ